MTDVLSKNDQNLSRKETNKDMFNAVICILKVKIVVFSLIILIILLAFPQNLKVLERNSIIGYLCTVRALVLKLC